MTALSHRLRAALLLPLLAGAFWPAVAASTPAAKEAAVLTLEALALAEGARVSLADVTRAGTTGARAAELAAVDLAGAPLPGYTLRLSRAEIVRLLRARALPYTLAPDGPAVVQVERRSQPYDQALVAQAAEQALQQIADADGSRLELMLSAPLRDLSLPAGKIALRVRQIAPQVMRQRHPTVWVDVTVDGNFLRTVPVGFELHAWRSALVAARPLDAGTAPGCADLVARDTDLTVLAGPAVEHCESLNGRLSRAVAQGEPLLQAQLKPASAVRQGDTVLLAYRAGAITVEARATALSDGAVGQRIEVRPAGALQAVRADVTGDGLVRISSQ